MRLRNTYLDCVRGLGICLVVFGHAQRGLHDAHLLPANYPFAQIDFPLYTFHMPLFFLLAGLYVWPSLEKGPASFIGAKFLTIVVPYFVWSIIQGGVQIVMAGSTNNALTLADWPTLFYAPLGQFWFLYALMIWQLIALACGHRRAALAVIAVVALAFGTALPDSFLATTMKIGVFFAAGTALGPRIEQHIAPIAHWKTFIFCTGAFGLTVHAIWHVAPIYSWQSLPAAIFGMVLTAIAGYWLNQSRARKPLVLCGQRSMHIYAMHIMAVAGTRIIAMKAGVGSAYVLLPSATAAGILLPLAASRALLQAKAAIRSAWPARNAIT
jgi:fucose 4-O-acetylase-like acetyltransferase